MARPSIFTDEQIAVMNKHNVPHHVAYLRVKKLKWPIDKALTKAVKKRKIMPKKDKVFWVPPMPDPKQAYQRFLESRKDKSHLVKYPQSVEPSDFYLYLKSKALWS
ncbi:TPA: hypothetical protein ACUI23_000533 [Staphylococcus pseudintermedius]